MREEFAIIKLPEHVKLPDNDSILIHLKVQLYVQVHHCFDVTMRFVFLCSYATIPIPMARKSEQSYHNRINEVRSRIFRLLTSYNIPIWGCLQTSFHQHAQVEEHLTPVQAE